MNILIIGSDGQLGTALVHQQLPENTTIAGVDIPQLDITDPQMVEKVLSERQPSVVINAAAYTDVDRAEKDPKAAFSINCDGPRHLAESCAKSNTPLVHISTDYVFDGNKNKPYRETDPVSPSGIYGQSKADGEIAVRSILPAHLIVRTSWLYGTVGHNFVKTMLKLGYQNDTVQVVADQYGSPTCADDLAATVLAIVHRMRDRRNITWGTYHYCGDGVISWFEFAGAIFEFARRFGLTRPPQVVPITTVDWPTPAKRPPYSALDCTLIEKNFGITTEPWQKSLKKTVECLMKQPSVNLNSP